MIERRAWRLAVLGVLSAGWIVPHVACAEIVPPVDTTGTIVALVRAKESGQALAYSVISLPAVGREQFTNDQGSASLTHVPVGRTQFRVRHLGYTPVDISITVHAGRVDTVRVEMSHIAVSLTAMRVHGLGTCTTPGPPRVADDPAFAAIFEQLRENADRYRLLADAYPFVYEMERVSAIHYVGGDSILERLDTIKLGTGTRWHYAPGAVVTETEDPRNRQVLLNIPALIQFAEPSFLSNHCFANGGMDTVNGRPAIRIDFAAAARIKAPDVNGSMYLDPRTFQIERSLLRLTKIPDETPQVASVDVVTEFREVLPSISLASEIRSTNVLFADPTRPVLPDAKHETQRLLHVTFLKGKPGEVITP